jgi:hypothetical protein
VQLAGHDDVVFEISFLKKIEIMVFLNGVTLAVCQGSRDVQEQRGLVERWVD